MITTKIDMASISLNCKPEVKTFTYDHVAMDSTQVHPGVPTTAQTNVVHWWI